MRQLEWLVRVRRSVKIASTRNGGMQDLNSLIGPSNFVLTSAVGINNVGMIMATGHDAQAGPTATRWWYRDRLTPSLA